MSGSREAGLGGSGTAGRISGRTMLAIVAGGTIVATLAMLLNDIVRTAYLFRGGYTLEAALGSPMGVAAELSGDSAQTTSQYWTVLISSAEPLAAPTALQTIALWMTSLTFVAAAVAIVLLCRRLWTGRTFAEPAAAALLALAVLALTTAWLAPWLRHRADAIALEELGYATSGDERWVSLPGYDIGAIDGGLLVLGIVLLLTGLVYVGARRLQQDTEGLV